MNKNEDTAVTETECNINVNHLTSINDTEVNSVSARDLHEFLEVSTRFNGWITDRIRQYGFIEGVDFVTFTENPAKLGRPSKEYTMSLDMAKELSMVERNTKGKEARQYFIRCEQLLKENLRLALEESERARQVAVRDKAKISANREATAIGRVGGLTASNNRLRGEVKELEIENASDKKHMDGLIASLTEYREAKPIICHIPEERPREIKRYHVEGLIQSFAYATNRNIKEVRREVYEIFNKRAKSFNLYREAREKNVAIIEIIRRRGFMDKLYDIVINCMKEFNNLIPNPEETRKDISTPENSGSFFGVFTELSH